METIDRCWQEYRKVIDENPFLTREREVELADVMHKFKGGKTRNNAREKLFLSNLRLVLSIAHTYNYTGHEFLDLFTAGCEGLIIAIDRFNPQKFKTKLSTYSVPWIRLKITQYLNGIASPVYIPAHLLLKGRQYNRLQKTIEKDDQSLTDHELMKKLEVSQGGLKNLRLASLVKTVPMDAPIENSERTVRDIIEDTKPTSDELCLENDDKEVIMAALGELSPIEQDVLTCRYLKGDKDNLVSVGKKYGITGEGVRQIEFKALRRMRKKLKNVFNFKK